MQYHRHDHHDYLFIYLFLQFEGGLAGSTAVCQGGALMKQNKNSTCLTEQ